MKAIDVKWDDRVNLLLIKCSCGHEWWHRLDRWWVCCPLCGKRGSVEKLRTEFAIACKEIKKEKNYWCPKCGLLNIRNLRYNQCPFCGAAVKEFKIADKGE